MQVDMYGLTTILNLYFDTPDGLLVRRSNEMPVYKEKLRLRSYGVPKLSSTTFLEIKKKYEGLVNKRRVGMTLQEAYDYVGRGIRPKGERSKGEEQILNEIDFFLERYDLQPGMNVNYQRVALFAREDPEFRITFDHCIRGRRDDIGLENGAYGTALIPDDYYLMETKILDATPFWFLTRTPPSVCTAGSVRSNTYVAATGASVRSHSQPPSFDASGMPFVAAKPPSPSAVHTPAGATVGTKESSARCARGREWSSATSASVRILS